MKLRGGRLVIALVLLAGAGALLGGVVTLQRIFLRERERAIAAISRERLALSQYARQALADALAGRLAASERSLEEARRDPLVATRELLLVEQGRALFPRAATFAPGDSAPAASLHAALAGGTARAEEGSPLAERLALHARLVHALARGDRGAIEESFRRFLGHRMLYVLPAAQDLALTVSATEALAAKAHPHAELLRGLLRDGLSDGRGGKMEGLQRTLLARREKLTERDFEFLAGRLAGLSERARVLHDDFTARAAERGGERPEVPAGLREPALLADGRWYAEPRPDGSIRGVAVPLEALLLDVAQEMRSRGLMGGDARLLLDARGTLPLARAGVAVESPRFAREISAARRAHLVKGAWALSSGLLAALLLALGVLWVRQERRYLALKSEFVATVSHELRTPLASVRVLAETLERRLGGSAEARDYPARIVREVDRLAFLVENILSFNRIARGKVTPRLSDVNLGELVEEIHRERGEGRDVELEAHGLSQTWLRADSELLQLLFSNLYENACRYSSKKPVRIGVSAAARDGHLDVLFADHGDGLGAGDEERVFSEFFRGARQESGARNGSGLGLAICRRIAALHGGEIRVVKSSAEGTTFGLSLPMS